MILTAAKLVHLTSSLLLVCYLLLSKEHLQVVSWCAHAAASPHNSSETITASELHALLELKARLAINLTATQAALLGAWTVTNSHNVCKSWMGVTCSYGDISGQPHIASINLTGFGLQGSLPPQLGNLTFLSTLILSFNLLTGTIPSELSRCSSLKYLELAHNSLTGPIPPSLTSLSALQVLRLSNNNLSGHIPSTLSMSTTPSTQVYLPKLQYLILWGNNLTGTIPLILSNCTSLLSLQLDNNKLTGEIPIELGALTNLTYLSLIGNELTGSIPSSLANCTSLQVLHLNDNHLTGPIPHSLGNLAGIEELNLSENNLTGRSIPRSLGNCTSLVIMLLYWNQLSGVIPTELGFLAKLRFFYLYGNSLTGSIPSSLANCISLVELDLSENNLTGAIPHSLGNCTSLAKLSVHSTQLSGLIPTELGLLGQLQNLSLQQNHLIGPIPRSLGNCTSSIRFELQSNQLSGSLPAEFGHLPQLRGLFLGGNELTGPIPQTLGNCTMLFRFNVSFNQLSNFIPIQIMNLKHLQTLDLKGNHLLGLKLPVSLIIDNATSLIELSVGSNRIHGSIPLELSQLRGLQYLDLSDNQFSGTIPWDPMSNCSHLYHLDLSGNHLSGSLSSNLGKLTKLRELYLQHNLLEGTIPDLGALSLQAYVDLSFNQLEGTLPDTLANVLRNVLSLDISHNNFSGNLPAWFGQLSMVEEIDLSHNRLGGPIPESLGDCTSLTYLNLSANNLMGGFPLQFSRNSLLSSLDLSNNQFSGVLPTSIEDFNHLSFVNISFNNFHGLIPNVGVFTHLDASCFQGNPGLCGQLIHKVCRAHHQVHLGQKIWQVLIIALATAVVSTLVLLAVCYYAYIRCSKSKLKKVDQRFNFLVGGRHFSPEALSESTQGYSEENLLGEGTFGVVYKGTLSSGEVVAVKKFKNNMQNTCAHEALLQEVEILSKLRHRNLVKIVGCVLDQNVHALVFDFMPNGNLEHYLCEASTTDEKEKRLCWPFVIKVAQGVANALTYLHHEYDYMPIIHGDVKPSNILLDAEFEAHLADFGLAKLAKSNTGGISLSSNLKGSIGYMAPEYAYTAKMTTKGDIYSFGVVILEMLTGIRPTDHELLGGATLHEWVKQKLMLYAHDDNDDDGRHNLDQIVQESLLQSSSLQKISHATKDGTIPAIRFLLLWATACTEKRPSKRPPTIRHIKEFLDSQIC